MKPYRFAGVSLEDGSVEIYELTEEMTDVKEYMDLGDTFEEACEQVLDDRLDGSVYEMEAIIKQDEAEDAIEKLKLLLG